MPCTSNIEQQKRTRLFICDAFKLFRQALGHLLNHQPDFRVIGEAATGEQALRLCLELSPDVALIDLQLPDMSGLEVAQNLMICTPGTRIILLAIEISRRSVLEAVEVGVTAYLPKHAEAEVLAVAIRRAAGQHKPLAHDAVEPLLARYGQRSMRLLERNDEPTLTERQRQVLRFLTQGASNREIAGALGMSEKTIRNLLSEVYQLLNVRNRTEAAVYALQRGWLASLDRLSS